ncbi:hypothetical protein C8T65DRAFT_630431 [Cerioporus squamosus]|nr:hypothetical protein C8T65DRAFT_630431 [Cerioporus squamosus]
MAKGKACRECSYRKVKCIFPEGTTSCEECTKRDTPCVRRTHGANSQNGPCDGCKKGHFGCEWSGNGPCLHCARTGAVCTLSGGDSPPPSSPSSDGVASPSRGRFFDIVLN